MDERKARNRMKPLSMLYVGLVYAFLYLPIVVVVLFSFNSSKLNIQFEGFTLEWYSKMFQNVREKAHLAYVASSSYLRHKNIIFVNCGIEISNYQKALDLIKQQIEDMKQGNFTEEDIANAKKGILATIKTIDDEQDTQISYYFGQELTNTRVSTEEYIKKIEKIQKEDVINIARKVSINTIYFLKD